MKKIILAIVFAMVSFMQVTFAGEVIPPNLVGQWLQDGVVGDVQANPEVIIFNKEGTFRVIGGFASMSGAETTLCLSTVEGTITSIQKTDTGYNIQGSGKTIPGGLIPLPGNTMKECQEADRRAGIKNFHFNISKISDRSLLMNGGDTFNKIFKVLDGMYCQK